MSTQRYWVNTWRSSVVLGLMGGLCTFPVSYAQLQQIDDKQHGTTQVEMASSSTQSELTDATASDLLPSPSPARASASTSPAASMSAIDTASASATAHAVSQASAPALKLDLNSESKSVLDLASKSLTFESSIAADKVKQAKKSNLPTTPGLAEPAPSNNVTIETADKNVSQVNNESQLNAQRAQSAPGTQNFHIRAISSGRLGTDQEVSANDKLAARILCGPSKQQKTAESMGLVAVPEPSLIEGLVEQVVQDCDERNGEEPKHNFTVEQLTLLRDCALEQGDPQAQNAMGLLSLQGKYMRPSPYKAAIYFAQAAAQGNVDAKNNLGELYLNGQGVDQNTAIAVSWFEQASAQGSCQAQYNLGRLYIEGRGVNQDLEHGFNLIKQAAKQGHALAQFFIGRLYLEGTGTKADKVKAAQWFNQACQQNFKQACRIIDKLELRVKL